jgi:hypothetical protein
MSQELHYTSVPRGLKPGGRGFCSVGMTPHMPAPLVDRLEALSGYQPVFPPHDPSAALNPVVFSHLRLTISGKVVNVLSRIGPAGLDYSGRPNKYAHHVVLEGTERSEAGPAWLLSQPSFMEGAWEGEPREIPAGRTPPQGDHQPGVATAWRSLVGDGGWAELLAETFLTDPRRTVFLVFRPGMDLLPLFVEALALLPFSRRWDVDFSTYFSPLPQGITCAWRGVLDGSDEAKNARRLPNAVFFDLCHLLGRAEGGVLVHLARTGERLAQHPGTPATPPGSGSRTAPMAREPSGPAPDRSDQTEAHRPPTADGSYSLAPELARLAPGARSLDVIGKAGPRRRPRGRSLAPITVFVVACLIPLIGIGFLLLRAPDTETRREITPPARQEEKVAATDARGSAEALKDNLPNPVNQPTQDKSNAHLDQTERAEAIAIKSKAAGSPAGRDLGDNGASGASQPAIVSGKSVRVEDPLFLALAEPVSETRGQSTQEPLRLSDPDIRIVKMELIGGEPYLQYEQMNSHDKQPKFVVFPIAKSKSIIGTSTKSELAKFEASTKREIKFRWDTSQQPVSENSEARQPLRDCVLKITSSVGEPQHCILRAKPLKDGSLIAHSGSVTRTQVTWDRNNAFKDTLKKIAIEDCKLIIPNRGEAIQLENKEDGSWVFALDRDELLSVKFGADRGRIQIDLRNGDPDSLGQNITITDTDLQNKRKESANYQSQQKTAAQTEVRGEKNERIADFDKEIHNLETKLQRLRQLQELYMSHLSGVITYEVAGTKFVIARVQL